MLTICDYIVLYTCHVLELALPEAVCHQSERLRLRVEQSAARPKRGSSATLHLRVNREVN